MMSIICFVKYLKDKLDYSNVAKKADKVTVLKKKLILKNKV